MNRSKHNRRYMTSHARESLQTLTRVTANIDTSAPIGVAGDGSGGGDTEMQDDSGQVSHHVWALCTTQPQEHRRGSTHAAWYDGCWWRPWRRDRTSSHWPCVNPLLEGVAIWRDVMRWCTSAGLQDAGHLRRGQLAVEASPREAILPDSWTVLLAGVDVRLHPDRKI